jgi:hypothetical protein
MLGSPVYGRLAGMLAEDPSPARRILGDDASWDLGLRLFGGVHGLVLAGAAPDALSGDAGDFLAALDAHTDELQRFVAEQGVQTNETQRCVGLLPAFLTIARQTGLPLDLLELGPSAGLNLVFDRYRYELANGTWGDPAALLAFEVTERAPVPAALLRTRLDVRRRRGIDLAPVDVTSDAGARLLRAFLWPGIEERVTRLEAAIETLRREPDKPELLQGDYLELLPALLADRPADSITVVFQTASTGYLSASDRIALGEALEEAGADGRPLAWVSTRAFDEREHDRDDAWEVELRIWPQPARMIAWLDFHGNWLEWIG